MRISVVGPMPPTRGGIAQHTAQVVDALRSAGHDVQVVAWRRQYPRALYRHDEVDASARDAGVPRTLVWWNPLTWFAARRSVDGHRPDVLWVPWVTPFHAFVVRTLLGARAGRRVVHVHNALPHERMPFARGLTRFGLRPAGRFVAHAAAIADTLHSIGMDQPCTVVAHPPNLDLSPTPLPNRPPTRLLFLGFVRPYKGLDIAFDALERLPDHYRLTVAGEFWDDAEPLRDRAGRFGERVSLDDRYVPDEEIGDLLGDHHLLVCPYRSATQSGLVPLAFAAGRPVVATDVGGLAEVVVDGKNGELSTVDPGAFAAAIERADARLEDLALGAAASAPSWREYADAVAS